MRVKLLGLTNQKFLALEKDSLQKEILKQVQMCLLQLCVVYFDQRTGAPHAFHWSKYFFEAETTFSITNGTK